MKRILVLLSFLGLNFMFSQDSEIPIPKYDREFKYSIKRDINTINFFDIDDLINVFISDFEFFKNCYLLSRKVPKEYEIKLENFFNNLKNNTIRDFDFDLNQDGVLGISKSIFDDSKITLTINPKLWSVSSTPKRLYVLYHELGHDVLNFKHGQGGKMMFTLSQSDYSLNEFYNDRGYMFFKFFEDFFKNLGYDKLVIIQNGGCFWSHYSYNSKNGISYYLGKPYTGTEITDNSRYSNSENHNIEYQEIKQGRLNGKYTKTTKEGQVLEKGNYIQKFIKGGEFPYVQYPVGEWKEFYSNGKIKSIKNYNSEGGKGQKVYHEEFFENGNLKIKYQYNYELQKYFGDKFEYYQTGKIKTKVDYDGTKEYYKEYYRNGDLKKTYQYDNGYQDDLNQFGLNFGLMIEYYENGKIMTEQTFSPDGSFKDFKSYDENGFLKIHSFYNHSENDKSWYSKDFFYFENGNNIKKESIQFYVGSLSWDTKSYFLNGNLKSIGKEFYSNERDELLKKGKWIYYNEDGSISKEEYYNDNGELITN